MVVTEGSPTFMGVSASFLFIPTYLLKHIGHKKKISILKLCLCYARLSTKGGKFRLSSCFQVDSCRGLLELSRLRDCLDWPSFSSGVLDFGKSISG